MASSTLSRLVPVSRNPTLNLAIQFRHRETPTGYLPAPDQHDCASENWGPAELEHEMAALRSSYTACLGDQGLPTAIQEMYRLVARLATEAAPSACQDLSESFQKADQVRTMNRFIRETLSERTALLDELTSRTHDTSVFRFHAHLGDYAGALCALLKEKKMPILSRPWTSIVPGLDECDKKVASWMASGSTGPVPSCPEKDEIVVRVDELIRKSGRIELDIDLALFAIRSYARRDFVSHGQIFDLRQSGNLAGLARYLDDDLKLLENVLPDEEKPMADNWRRLILSYKQRHLAQGPDGQENHQPAPGDAVPGSPLPPQVPLFIGQAVLRNQIEMGQHREEHSRGGPPAQNVKFDTSITRRRSEPMSRGRIAKRRAGGHSPKRPSVVRARHDLHISELDLIAQNVSNEHAKSIQELQLDLHTLAMQLALVAPAKAFMELKPVKERLEKRLEQAKEAVERNYYRAIKASSRAPKCISLQSSPTCTRL